MTGLEKQTAPKSNPTPARPQAPLPFKAIILVTLAGGLVSALVGLLLGGRDWALGSSVGALLSAVGLLGLKATLRRLLVPGTEGAKGMLMVQSYIRWILAAGVMFLLLKISAACLLGAVLSYSWFLGVLAFYGIRSATVAAPLIYGPNGPVK